MGKMNKQERARKYADGAKEAVRLAYIQEVVATEAVSRLTDEIKEDIAELGEMQVLLDNKVARIKELEGSAKSMTELLGKFQRVVADIGLSLDGIHMTVETTAEKLGMDLSKIKIPEDAVIETESLSRAEKEAQELAIQAAPSIVDDIPLIEPEAEVERKMKISDEADDFLEREG